MLASAKITPSPQLLELIKRKNSVQGLSNPPSLNPLARMNPSSLKKRFGSTSPIPRASITNSSSSQMSYKKFVKQSRQQREGLGEALPEWRGFTHHFIAKKLNQVIESKKKLTG